MFIGNGPEANSMRDARKIFQPSLWQPRVDTTHSRELGAISDLLDENPQICQWVWEDLTRGTSSRGAKGLTAEQVLRALILKQMHRFSYEELTFYIADSVSFRYFCHVGLDSELPSRSALAAAIKALRPETLERINQALLEKALECGLEDGQKVRVDCTAVETNIHHPTDSELLWDSVRVLGRELSKARKILGEEISLPEEESVAAAKRLRFAIACATRKTKSKPLYGELIELTQTLHEGALHLLPTFKDRKDLKRGQRRELERIAGKIESKLPLVEKVIAQARRRVLDEEKVPAAEKVVSIFEEHTDIIQKGIKNTRFGHKVCLTAGASNLVLDCDVLRGNPADVTLAKDMIDRQIQIYGQPPEQAAFDGGFASKPNLEAIKNDAGVLDVVFAKKRGLKVDEMARSPEIYRHLRNFRAGIEGIISNLKRTFGLRRCTWRSLPSFKSYVWASILSSNLVVLARHLLSSP
jgi:IS5 family transposase